MKKTVAKYSPLNILLATDDDREGEAIAWHICQVCGLDPVVTKRIVFHEITKPAIKSAVEKPRTVNMNLVNAQQARRILDRIVGFEISPILWRKMSMKNNLSAGRVQSVAVRIIVERERAINGFTSTSSFKIEGYFKAKDINGKQVTFKAEGTKKGNEQDAEQFLTGCIGAKYTVKDVQKKPGRKSPAAPFTTSTLQQEASRKLGYGVSKTMLIAQKLYEAGHITYMRTDSVNLSETAVQDISKQITDSYGKPYLQVRKYKNKNESESNYKKWKQHWAVLSKFPEVNIKKIKSAATDAGREVVFDEKEKPGISNLLTIHSSLSGRSIAEIENEFAGKGYGDFKAQVAEVVVEYLRPIRDHALELLKDEAHLLTLLHRGGEKAQKTAASTLEMTYKNLGLVQ
jgi:DNA topoisomerase IA